MRRYSTAGFLVILIGQSLAAALAQAPRQVAVRGVELRDQLLRERPSYAYPATPNTSAKERIDKSTYVKMFRRPGVRLSVRYPGGPPRVRTRDPLATNGMLGLRATGDLKKQGPTPRMKSATRAFLRTSTPLSIIPRRPVNPNAVLSDTGAGVSSWFEYLARNVPGIGVALQNTSSGNLIIRSTDISVPERGIDLEMTRTYNSQSLHDVNGDDGSEPAIFGNGWTNAYDAHLVPRSNGQTITAISVYDGVGTRCDYTPDGNGNWIPCTGQHAILEVDPSNACSYWWIQKDGSAYWFHSPVNNCINQPATFGRVFAIYGRNSNNVVTLAYSFVPNEPETSQYVTEIDANHSDGHTLRMVFAQAGSGGPNELETIVRPDSQPINYYYDNLGDLKEVDKPGNDPLTPTLEQTYGVQTPIQYACGPRATMSGQTDGACIHFDYDSSSRLADWKVNAVLNPAPVPNDGLGYIQPGVPHGWQTFYVANFVYGATTGGICGNTPSSALTVCDTNGHSFVYILDSFGRTTAIQRFTSAHSSLTIQQAWDANNNLISATDSNGNEIDYAYDANGNRTAVGYPKMTTSNGTFRPTYLFSYDASNNVVGYCDPVFSNSINMDFSSSFGQSDSLCPQTIGSPTSPGAAIYKYQTETAEPYGMLSDRTSPAGYHYSISYSVAGQGGDFGEPTQVAGDSFQINGNSIAPTQNFTYDVYGNQLTAGNTQGKWTTVYDSLNRPTSRTDPTGVTGYLCYNYDGSVSSSTSPLQFEKDGGSCGSVSVHYKYDVDGDLLSDYRGYTGGTTYYTYDGLDRLVEAQVPADGNIDGNQTGLTRYFYDLSQLGSGANLTIGSKSGLIAYGNMYKVLRCVGSPCSYQDIFGNTFDGTDRPTGRFQYSPTTLSNGYTPGQAPGPLNGWIFSYDAPGQAGLPSTRKDPNGTTTTYSYDAINDLTGVAYNDGQTPSNALTYDADGRLTKQSSSVGIETYGYYPDGTKQSFTEGGNLADPETLTYNRYPNGWEKSLQVQDNAVGLNETFSYNYRKDGVRTSLTLGSWEFDWTYDNAGRVTSFKDPYYQSLIPSGNWSGTNSPIYANGITIGKRTLNYDPSSGELASLTMSSGAQYSNIQYDAAGDMTSYTVSVPGFQYAPNVQYGPTDPFVTGVQYGFDVRREFSQLQATAPTVNNYVTVQQTQVNSGHPFTCSPYPCRTGGLAVDANTGAVTNLDPPSPQPNCSAASDVSYDSDGRQSNTIYISNGFGCPGASFLDERGYDAEGHTTSSQSPPGISVGSYLWSPSGHLASANITNSGVTTTENFHWDGDILLFVTNSSHAVVQNNVEQIGYQNGTGGALVVYDRDASGTIVESHTGQADSGISTMQNYFSPSSPLSRFGIATLVGSYPSAGMMPNPPVVTMARTDGYGINNLHVQNIRNYDSTAQQWTTPDEYRGSDSEPLSQWGYQWNGNNPLGNSDPSGYLTICSQTDAANNGDGTCQGSASATAGAASDPPTAVQIQLGYVPNQFGIGWNHGAYNMQDWNRAISRMNNKTPGWTAQGGVVSPLIEGNLSVMQCGEISMSGGGLRSLGGTGKFSMLSSFLHGISWYGAVGITTANRGASLADVQSGTTYNFSAGFGFGLVVQANESGDFIGIGAVDGISFGQSGQARSFGAGRSKCKVKY